MKYRDKPELSYMLHEPISSKIQTDIVSDFCTARQKQHGGWAKKKEVEANL